MKKSKSKPTRLHVILVVALAVMILAPALIFAQSEIYRVRTSWEEADTQIGAFRFRSNAEAKAEANPGYRVYNEQGEVVWPLEELTDGLYRVRRTWADAESQKGAFESQARAVRAAQKLEGYQVFDAKGEVVWSGDVEVPAETAPAKAEPQALVAPAKERLATIDNTERGWSYLSSRVYVERLRTYEAYMESSQKDKVIYLSFDMGYDHEDNTARILNALNDAGAQASFFINDGSLLYSLDLVQRMANEGHAVGNHGIKHLNMPQTLDRSMEAAKAEIVDFEVKYQAMTGRALDKIYRPASGIWSERTFALAQQLGYRSFQWSFAYLDWDTKNQPAPSYALEQLKANTTPGAIIELHTVSDTNAAIMADYLAWAKSEGYTFAPLTAFRP